MPELEFTKFNLTTDHGIAELTSEAASLGSICYKSDGPGGDVLRHPSPLFVGSLLMQRHYFSVI